MLGVPPREHEHQGRDLVPGTRIRCNLSVHTEPSKAMVDMRVVSAASNPFNRVRQILGILAANLADTTARFPP